MKGVKHKRGMTLLTERQKQVARLVAEGKADKDIAEDLGISKSTVTTTLTIIYSKMGLNHRSGDNIRVKLANMVREGCLEGGNEKEQVGKGD